MAERKPLVAGKLRTSQWGGWCCVCLEPIEAGERYFDAGATRRAHHDCACHTEITPDMEHGRREQNAAAEAYYAAQAKRVMGAKAASSPPPDRNCIDCAHFVYRFDEDSWLADFRCAKGARAYGSNEPGVTTTPGSLTQLRQMLRSATTCEHFEREGVEIVEPKRLGGGRDG